MPSRKQLANAIRVLSMDAVQKAKSGHPGAPMGMADIAEVLWNSSNCSLRVGCFRCFFAMLLFIFVQFHFLCLISKQMPPDAVARLGLSVENEADISYINQECMINAVP